MRYRLYLLLFFLLYYARPLHAQTTQKVTKTINDAGSVIDAGDKLMKKVFPRGNEKPGGEPGKKKEAASAPDAENNGKPVSAGKAPAETASAGKAGSLHPQVVWVEADNFSDFNGGAAVIKRGNASALINALGEMIIPYNSPLELNSLRTNHDYRGQWGFFSGYDRAANKSFLLSASGKKIFDRGNKDVSVQSIPSEDSRYLSYRGNDRQTMFYVDTTGKLFAITNPNPSGISSDTRISEGLVLVQARIKNDLYQYGYKNLNDKWVISPTYDEAEPFSEGMAVVGKKNEFGEMKYGYIDRSGKQVIPIQYSQKPHPFRYGAAIVEPVRNNSAGLHYILINAKGETLTQVFRRETDRNGNKPNLPALRTFTNGLIICFDGKKLILDSAGNIIPFASFLTSLGLPDETTRFGWESDGTGGSALSSALEKRLDPPVVYYESKHTYQNRNILQLKGFALFHQKKAVEPVFSEIRSFDPVSRLAYAKMPVGKDMSKADAFREGYINEDGVFVIVKKAAGDF